MTRKGKPDKFKCNLKHKDLYNYYKSNVIEPLTHKQHSQIMDDVFESVMQMVIKEGLSVKFPYKFGKLEIQKRKQKIKYNTDGTVNRICYKIDWQKTKQHWNEIYGNIGFEELKKITNKPKIYHNNKFRMSFKYLKTEAQYKNKSVIMFIPSRKWCRELAHHLKTDPYKTDYKEQY